MKAVVTAQPTVIPRELLGGMTEVEIRNENNRIIIPLQKLDPILRLGSEPIDDTITDGSVNHDRYLHL